MTQRATTPNEITGEAGLETTGTETIGLLIITLDLTDLTGLALTDLATTVRPTAPRVATTVKPEQTALVDPEAMIAPSAIVIGTESVTAVATQMGIRRGADAHISTTIALDVTSETGEAIGKGAANVRSAATAHAEVKTVAARVTGNARSVSTTIVTEAHLVPTVIVRTIVHSLAEVALAEAAAVTVVGAVASLPRQNACSTSFDRCGASTTIHRFQTRSPQKTCILVRATS